MGELVNNLIGGVRKRNVAKLSKMCPAAKFADLASILDNFQTALSEVESFWGDSVDDRPALSAIASADIPDTQVRIVKNFGVYQYDEDSVEVHDGDLVISPDDLPATGRWIKVASFSLSHVEADEVSYDNSTSGLTATEVQAALDEIDGIIDALDAAAIPYDNSTSGLAATDVQAAIDEVDGNLDNLAAADVSFDNTTSGLAATDVQGAIDEVDGTVDGIGTALGAHILDTGNPHAVTAAQAGAIEDANDTVKDTHIDWGNGANQVDASDMPVTDNAGVGQTTVQSALDIAAYGAGCPDHDYLAFIANPAAMDRFTITDGVTPRTYGYNDVTADVNIPLGGNVGATIDNAVAAINADAASIVKAEKAVGTGLLAGGLILVGELIGGLVDLSININVGAGMVLSGRTQVECSQFPQKLSFREVSMTAQDIIQLAAGIEIDLASVNGGIVVPVIAQFMAQSGGVILPMNTYQLTISQPSGSGFYVVKLADPLGTAQLSAGDTITIGLISR